MPKYRVTIGGQTFEVASDKELSDTEVYQYAKQQMHEPPPTPDALSGFQHAQGIGPEPGVLDRLLNLLPTLGGAAGGLIGGAGGTAFGLGFGGVPGAVGGAAFGGATGEAVRQTGRRILGGTRDVPPTATQAATDIGTQGAVQGGLELGGAGAMRGLGVAGEATYRGYLKPSLAARNLPKAREIVQTAIDEALPVTAGGAQQARNVIRDIRGQVEDVLANTSGTVDLHQVADRVRQFAKTKYFRPGTPSADYDAALAVADAIDKHPSLGLPAGAQPTRIDITPTQANEVKRGLDTSIGETQFGVKSGAATSAEKFARRDLRQELERLAPDIGPMNARESRLIDTAKAIERAVGREGNQSATHGVKTLASVAVGGEEWQRTGDPYTAAAKALALRVGLDPYVATKAAIIAARLGKMTGAVPANIARAAIIAASESQDQGDNNPNSAGQNP